MAKDDYFVVVYKVLAYLYSCLKKGETPDDKNLQAVIFDVNREYWDYIIINLQRDGYIRDVIIADVDGTKGVVVSMKHVELTPAGIAYLFDNNFMSKVKNALGSIGGALDILQAGVDFIDFK